MHGLEILDLDMKIAYTFTSYSVFGVTTINYVLVWIVCQLLDYLAINLIPHVSLQ